MLNRIPLFPVCTATLLVLASQTLLSASLPEIETPKKPATNTYNNVQIQDPYQWLEESAAPETKEWSRKQNERTQAYLSQFKFRDGIAQQLMQLRSEESARFTGLREAKGRLFALRFKPPAQQPVLVRLSSMSPPALWKPIFDPNVYNTNGTTAIDWYVPSLDGTLVAICLSENGSEQGTLHFFEVETGKELEDKIPRVQYPTAGGSAAWLPDNKGILYTRYPRQGERPDADLNFYQQVWSHKIGTPSSDDKYETGKEFPRIAETELETSEDGQWSIAIVSNGDGGDYAHFVRDPSGTWKQLTRFEDEIKGAVLGRNNHLYLTSRKNAPRGKVLEISLSSSMALAQAKEIVPQRDGVVQEVAPSDNGVYVSYLVGGPSELAFFPKGSSSPKEIPTLPVSSVGGVQSWHGDEVVFGNVSYLQPFAWYTWNPSSKEPVRTAIYTTSPVDFSDLEVIREFATSKDGTKVPLNIIRRKGLKLDGQNPTILYGYGGYGISLSPGFDATRRLWFDAGGVYVVANLRGGGEFGETWHKQGNLTNKQNVFDDFIASAEYLIKKKYTSPSRLAVEGASNGGLLMGAFLTQRPELARAVVSRVGIYDMLRVELDPNGQFNVTEFGTVKDPEHFKALMAYSPYHRVKDATHYPAVLLATGENDGRVNPMQSRKMTARLQEATVSNNPVLYRSTASAGHGMGSSLKDRISEQTDIYTFLFNELGIRSEKWQFE
jgi:prolyl oligopeptidase